MRSRHLRLVGIVLAGAAFALAVRAWQGGSRAVDLRYEAPRGELTVTLATMEDERVRRIVFGPGVARQHRVRLPDGRFKARLRMPGQPEQTQLFRVERDGPVLIRWR